MFDILDTQLFPDECIVLDTGYELVYPIFKNGSSSLSKTYRPVRSDVITNAKCITVYVREPLDRFYSGVNTYLKNNPILDSNTVIELINRHLFLDRHFCPQFYWLVNLRRFTSAEYKILDMSQLSNTTTLHVNKSEAHTTSDYFESNDKIHFYLSMDKILYWDLMGETVSFNDIVYTLKIKWPDVYKEVIERSKTLCSVLD